MKTTIPPADPNPASRAPRGLSRHKIESCVGPSGERDFPQPAKTTISGPSEGVSFLGLEIKRNGDGYRLRAPSGKLEAIEADMAAIASIERCVAETRNIGHVVRSLDSFTIGHAASMAVLEDGGQFLSRLQACKQRQLKAFLVSLIGENAVERLDDDRLAILGLQPFKR